MSIATRMRRPRGRPSKGKDKNGLPRPIRADRDRPLKWLFDEVPREGLYDAMLLSGDERFRRLHGALHDDAYRKTSFATLCRRFGCSRSDCMNLWWEYNRYWGLLALANRLPKILDDIAEDAESHDGPCPVCDGIGYVALDSLRYTCVECDGGGRVPVPGDEHARQRLLQIIGLTGSRK